MLRVEAGLSLRELARQIGVSSAYLSRVENQRDPPPTPDRLIAIAEALDLSADLIIELANQTAPALASYIEEVPAASGFFLEVARRRLGPAQLARLRELMNEEFPEVDPGADPAALSSIIGPRIVVALRCESVDQLVDRAVAQLAVDSDRAAEIARLIRERERVSPTALGKGVAVPHALVPGVRTAAILVTLAEPLAHPSPDDRPIEVAVVLVSGEPGQAHLEILARIAQLARRDVAGELRAARSARQVRRIIDEVEGVSRA